MTTSVPVETEATISIHTDYCSYISPNEINQILLDIGTLISNACERRLSEVK